MEWQDADMFAINNAPLQHCKFTFLPPPPDVLSSRCTSTLERLKQSGLLRAANLSLIVRRINSCIALHHYIRTSQHHLKVNTKNLS